MLLSVLLQLHVIFFLLQFTLSQPVLLQYRLTASMSTVGSQDFRQQDSLKINMGGGGGGVRVGG